MPLEVVVEAVANRAFASVLRWPGWSRGAKTEDGALEALLAYAPRYREALGAAAAGMPSPKTSAALRVVERLEGNSSTSFGAFGRTPAADEQTLPTKELTRRVAILRAAWEHVDRVAASTRAPLRTGPRGGGRDLAKIRAHLLEALGAYVAKVGGVRPPAREPDRLAAMREVFLDALEARNCGELADVGPRGGSRWSAAYAIRVETWHTLDHAWEIEDRAT